jgi:hypothetical protein
MGIERSNVFIFQHEPMLPPRLRRTEKPLQSMVDVASIIEDFVDRSQKRAAGASMALVHLWTPHRMQDKF